MSRKSPPVLTFIITGLIVVLVAWAPAGASVYRTIDDASAEDVVSGMSEKAARGLVNIATGWLEFPRQIYTNYQDHGPLKGCLVGPLMGIGMTVTRTVAGALEFATFYLALPGFYDPLLEPPYVWENLER